MPSDPGLHCLLRHIRPNTWRKYGTLLCQLRKQSYFQVNVKLLLPNFISYAVQRGKMVVYAIREKHLSWSACPSNFICLMLTTNALWEQWKPRLACTSRALELELELCLLSSDHSGEIILRKKSQYFYVGSNPQATSSQSGDFATLVRERMV